MLRCMVVERTFDGTITPVHVITSVLTYVRQDLTMERMSSDNYDIAECVLFIR